jgi:hypothetical protein
MKIHGYQCTIIDPKKNGVDPNVVIYVCMMVNKSQRSITDLEQVKKY